MILFMPIRTKAFVPKLLRTLRDLGGCMSPFNAYMTLLGLETLSLRMDKHVENSRRLLNFYKIMKKWNG